MGNLQEKLARLPPGLLQEVEDYVDYLLERRSLSATEEQSNPETSGFSPEKPIIFAQETPIPEIHSYTQNYSDLEGTPATRENTQFQSRKEKDPKGILDWID